MKHIRKFNEEIGNPYNSSKIEKFIALADKIINNNEEYEQGDDPSNVDILSELGDLCNELDMTNDEIDHVINSGRLSDVDGFLNDMKQYYEEPITKKEPTEDQIIDTIINCVDIRGMDLIDYRHKFTDEQSGLITALRKLFNNK